MTFFNMETRHILCWYSDESLFGHFMTTLNSTFEQKLALEDKGYESGSENFNLPTPLQQATRIHHVTSTENASFHPSLVVSQDPHLRCICRRLEYSSSDDTSVNETTPTHPQMDDIKSNSLQEEEEDLEGDFLQGEDDVKGDFLQEEDDLTEEFLQAEKDDLEEDFQTVPLDDELWTAELAPNRLLCIHSHLLPHELCIFPCPYMNYLTPAYLQDMNLSDISESEEYMVVSSNEDIPSLEQWETSNFIMITYIFVIDFIINYNQIFHHWFTFIVHCL